MNITGEAFAARSRIYISLATTLEAGLPLPAALRSALGATASWTSVGQDLARQVEGGETLSRSMARSGAFSDIEIRLVEAGERSGRLPEALARLGGRFEHLAQTRGRLIWGLAYPVLLLHAAIFLPSLPLLVGGGTGTFVAAVLPQLFILYGVSAGLCFLLPYLARTPAGLDLPILGPWSRQRAVADYAFVLGSLVSAGGSLPAALRFAADSMDLPLFKAAGLRIAGRVERGSGLGPAFSAEQGVFGPLFVEQIKIGEVAGRLEPGLRKAEEIARDDAAAATRHALVCLTVGAFAVAAGLIAWHVISFWSGYAANLTGI